QFRKDSFEARTLSVNVQADTGKQMTVMLGPSKGPVPVRSANNQADLQSRLAWRNHVSTSFYTRDDLKQMGLEWISDAVRVGGVAQYDNDCNATLNGGPDAIDISTLTVDDVEAIEIYNSARGGIPLRRNAPPSPTSAAARRGTAAPRMSGTPSITNTRTA